ncbi:hypothetical protein Neosp_004789 [[Neocosmospora] mangrovei]
MGVLGGKPMDNGNLRLENGRKPTDLTQGSAVRMFRAPSEKKALKILPSQKLTGDLLDLEGGKECGKRDESFFNTLQAINRPVPLLPTDYGAEKMNGTCLPGFGTAWAVVGAATILVPVEYLPASGTQRNA